MTTNVFMWSADSAGCAHFRCVWPAETLTEMYGDEIQTRTGTTMTREDQEWADVVVGQRVVLPGPTSYWRKWSGSKKLVAEFDDDLFTVNPSNYKASAIFNKPEIQKRLMENIRVADLVTVSTEELRQALHKHSGKPLSEILVIPNALPERLVLDPSEAPDRSSDALFGWMASPTHNEDAAMVSRHLRKFYESNPSEMFRTIGTDYGPKMKLSEKQVRHDAWIRNPEKAVRMIDYQVGVCPLTGSSFNRSKSDCKAIELGARFSMPLVSDVPAYSPIEDGVTGIKVKREHEWNRTLRAVASDPEMRREIAANANAWVRENRTMRSTAPLWREAVL